METRATSGSIVVNHPFVLAVSGAVSLGMIDASEAIIIAPSGAELHWIELKKQ